MKLVRIEIEGFGQLRDVQMDIAPGLHIFAGPNERGKSHLQQAILAMLYGFYEDNRARKDENERRERYVPWNGDTYAARLDYELSNGHRFRVSRDFSTPDQATSIWDLSSGGTDVTSEFGRGRRGNVPFARQHLGMTKRVFESCAFVSHGELFQIVDETKTLPQEIGETIIRLADTAGRDISARTALAQLDKVLREQVGGAQARATPLPVARGRLAALRAELLDIDRVREEVARECERLDGAKAQRVVLLREVAHSRYLLSLVEASKLRGRLDQLEDLGAKEISLRQLLAEHLSFGSFPVEERDAVLEARQSVRDLRESIDARRNEIEEQRRRLDELNTERQSLIQRERELVHVRDFPVDRKAEVDRLMSDWQQAGALAREAQSRLETAAAQANPILDEYERLAARVGHLTTTEVAQLMSQLQAPPRGGVGWPIRAVFTTIGRALPWAWRQMAALARWIWSTIRRKHTPAPVETGPTSREGGDALSVSREEAQELLVQRTRLSEIAPLAEKYEQERVETGRADERVEDAAKALRNVLAGILSETEDLERAHQIFLEHVEGRRELESVTERLSGIERERSACARAVDSFDKDVERLDRLETQLRERLHQVNGALGDIDVMVQAFEEGCRRRGLFEEAKRDLREIERQRGTVLAGRSKQELEELIGRLETERERQIGQHQWLSGVESNDSREVIQQRLMEMEDQLSRIEVEIGRLNATIDTKQGDLRSRAEVEEEIALCESEVAGLERFGDALRVAIEVIRTAADEAHRDFAPVVGRFLGDGLARVTGGRYQQIWLDPKSLHLTAEAPETRRPESVEFLSRGTRAAAYLLLRIGLAQHMSGIREPVPIMLDDPLVDLDDARRDKFLELLFDLSETVQVLLFTKDENTIAWFEEHCRTAARCAITVLRETVAQRLARLAPAPLGEPALTNGNDDSR